MRNDEWHYLFIARYPAYSLYADPGCSASEGLLQWVLPECGEYFVPTSKELDMKGLWNSEKSVDATYRPALDALRAVDASTLAVALLAVVENGCAFMVSATRDHGAICLTLLDGDRRHKVYPSNVQELNQALLDLSESFASSKPASKARPSTR